MRIQFWREILKNDDKGVYSTNIFEKRSTRRVFLAKNTKSMTQC